MAFCIVDAEDEENWSWFFQHLSQILDADRVISFISDRNYGLIQSIPKIFPTSHHAFCLEHLKRNLRDKFSGSGCSYPFRERIVFLFGECAKAPTMKSFHYRLNELLNEGKDMLRDFIKYLPFHHWSSVYFRSNKYGEMSSNAAESFNAWIAKARHLPITNLVDDIRLKIMKQMSKRRKEGSVWNNEGICPEMNRRLEMAFNTGRTWTISTSSEYVFQVNAEKTVTVDLLDRTCSCGYWQINGLPCAHVVTAIAKSGLNLKSYVDRYFHVEAYCDSYALSIFPVPTIEMPESSDVNCVIMPPSTKKAPGRPRERRLRSRGEDIRKMKCSRCKKYVRHNRRTCNEAV